MTPVIVRSGERSKRPAWRSEAANLFFCIVCNQPVQLVFTLTQVWIVCCGVDCVTWSGFTALQLLWKIRLKELECSVCKYITCISKPGMCMWDHVQLVINITLIR